VENQPNHPVRFFFRQKKRFKIPSFCFFWGYSELGMKRQKLKITGCAGVIFMISVPGQILDSF